MPKISVWMVRASLIYMGVGFWWGSLILHHKGVPIYPWTWRLLDPHIEFVVFGWGLLMVMGVAYWILPRFSGAWRYGDLRWGWACFITLNLGTCAGALGAWWAEPPLRLAGRLLILFAVLFFAVSIWARVKPLTTAPKLSTT
ncbi:MAG: hypothetical protein MUF38_18875 [Anaerolineae bacterium]|nr:hypothetical protein [Anaerolineae bacterium]